MCEKKRIRWWTIGLTAGILWGCSLTAQAEPAEKSEVVVLYHPDDTDVIRSFAEVQGDEISGETAYSEDMAVAVVEVGDISPEEAAEQYKTEEHVIAASPNYELELFDSAPVNDTGVFKQTYLRQEAAVHGWQLLQNISHNKVRVAVLDTGADIHHPDLKNILNLTLSGEILDNNGKIGPLQGDGYVQGVYNGYTKSHGTHVSGIIAAEANNNEGIAGVGSAVDNSVIDLMVVDAFSKEKTTSLAYLIQGMEYARKSGAKIINLSLGVKMHEGLDDSVLRAECERLEKSGVILVCAAGNYGEADYGTVSVVPSDYDSTISVIAVDNNNQKLVTSNYGVKKDISAAGANIFSTLQNEKYGNMSGTSMAAPSVTAAAAMLCSVNPSLTTESVRDILQKTATDTGMEGKDTETASGLLNIRRAIETVQPDQNVSIQMPYLDVNETDWFYGNVSNMYQYGMMTGLEPSVFGPTEMICRAQFAVILYRYEGEPEVSYKGRFPDVPEGQFYTEAVEWAADKGIIRGYDNGYFGPGDTVTREQMAALLYRYADSRGYAVSLSGDYSSFPDAGSVTFFAEDAMKWAVGKRIIQGYGDGTLAPQHTSERAVCAAMLERFMDYY